MRVVWITLAAALLGCADGGNGTGGTDSGDGTDGDSVPVAEEVDPDCIDGEYTEHLADPNGDITAAIDAFDDTDPLAFLLDALDVRYPTGSYLIEGGLEYQQIDCFERFTTSQDRGSTSGLMRAASTVVHECGHMYDISSGGFSSATYVVTDVLTLTCSGGGRGDTFVRSNIFDDEYQDLNPNDFYASTYLTGASGNQGFDMLFEETVQYVNSLATGYAFNDAIQGQISERDGILTFLWYVERYLRMARLDDPSTYAALAEDPCWREAILTIWGRAWLYLEATEDVQGLGISDDDLIELVRDPDLLNEIELLRDAEGC